LVCGITTLLQKKIDRSIRFGAVGYIITLYSSKSYAKSWGSVQILRGLASPTPSVVAPLSQTHTVYHRIQRWTMDTMGGRRRDATQNCSLIFIVSMIFRHNHTLFIKKLRKKLGVRPNFGGPNPPPVVMPMSEAMEPRRCIIIIIIIIRIFHVA